ncbi:hypothetical protein JVT61DRAFT_2183 [Boletus reticuloceps]|uniref:Uncharacterized protein n=1 Tax=Boletus reticuloceps TaxID=495285 RepID=A0A8I3A8V7_9AGAM|nr:hypothetical protein JVT61DRAFT_2183 [Boletus reticuloceps]
MPSLRRSFSSPSVRSSPYPSSLSSITSRTRPPPRRPSPSATAERRVLADIDWWRVHDGQCDLDLQHHDHARDDAHELDAVVPLGGTVTLSAGGGSQMHSFALHPMQYVYPDALSVAPYSPPGSRHGRDSSVESTPEMPTAPLETVELDPASPALCPFGDLFSFPASLTRAGGRQIHPLFGLRSISVPGWSHQVTLMPDFADMGGDSFSFDQNLFQ